METPEISGYRSAVHFILFLPSLFRFHQGAGYRRKGLVSHSTSHYSSSLHSCSTRQPERAEVLDGGRRPAEPDLLELGHDPIELLAARGVSAHNGGQLAEHNKQYAMHFQFCPRTDVVATRLFVTLAKLQMAGACLLDVRTPAITSRPSDTSPERTARPRVRLLL